MRVKRMSLIDRWLWSGLVLLKKDCLRAKRNLVEKPVLQRKYVLRLSRRTGSCRSHFLEASLWTPIRESRLDTKYLIEGLFPAIFDCISYFQKQTKHGLFWFEINPSLTFIVHHSPDFLSFQIKTLRFLMSTATLLNTDAWSK